MRQTAVQLIVMALFAALVMLVPASAHAAKKDKAPKDNGVKGSITAIDKAAKTVTVKGEAILTDATTVITRSGKTITFEDLKVGEAAEVSTFTLNDKLTAVTIRVGAPPVASNTSPGEVPKKKKKP